MNRKKIFSLLTSNVLMISVLAGTIVTAAIRAAALEVAQDVPEVSVKVDFIEKFSVEEELNVSTLKEPLNDIQATEFEKANRPVPCKITTYGVDCYGCNYTKDGLGGTSSGVMLSWAPSVRQKDGTWKKGLTYEGYYVVATNRSIPLGSIIEVSNHGYSGYGLVPGKTFYAMVLDRGAMGTNHLDLFVGAEGGRTGVRVNRNYQPYMRIIRYGY